jgi:hypothetical protein
LKSHIAKYSFDQKSFEENCTKKWNTVPYTLCYEIIGINDIIKKKLYLYCVIP